MVYIKKWAEFQAQSIALYEASPARTRYVIRVRPSDEWLVLKVTDDVKTLKFKTRSSIILNRFEIFNRDMMAAIVGAELPSRIAAQKQKEQELAAAAEEAAKRAVTAAGAATVAVKEASGQAAAGSGGQGANTGGGAGGGGGGGGKKKKKKGKK
ncbi:signal recognition particle, SRP9/SRP14 subunit [Tilletiaria anomala UBC 951]|uniref:Signal recognition particle, SRP9/SRP14 subunit n=1 Tax=Tilletiaria anomala (strain ATCC 24038 / CBS 436.72 / UBC 951) TaxID=1037660 RepID=A0A066VD80_TILAU|nr:signal recognition particle, SRP9/SRP14 subunit [Tilletiaria anomala UBC 951]KDN36550.1 signal recognition particle, SRP9/SRP14 subunit [Tilletiaria anomala UBC 951]